MNYISGWRRGAAQPTPSPEPPQHFSSAGGPTRSLELVRFNQQSGKFEVGEEALAVLRSARGPVGVVAVAGRARQGKSYILNQLLGKSGGFTVGPTHRPCTKGLWMWSAPVERTAPDGSTYSLVLLDTEGIDAYDQTGQYSTQIFSLAVLLSSLFIYNQMGGIDEAALDRLSLVTEMTKHIRVRASDGTSADPSELAAFTPSFIWLLRDFYLRLEEDGQVVTPRDYLEAALQTIPGSNPAVQSKNKIRESIKALFPDRDCFTLVRPVNEEDLLARLDSLPHTALRPEFKRDLAALTKLTFQKAMPKRLGAQVLTGPALAALTEAYVTAINAGAVPTIATAWQGVAEAESRRAADAAEVAYAAAFPSPDEVEAEDGALEACHQRAMRAAQRAFDAQALGDVSIRKANEKRWREACANRFRELREKKLATAELACEKALNEAATRVAEVVRRDGVTLEELQREVMAFQERYASSRECAGPTKWRRLAEFMRDVYGNAQKDLATRQAERERAIAAQAQAAAQAAQTAVQQASARAAAAEGSVVSLQSRIGDLERQIAQLSSEVATERRKVAEMVQNEAGRASEWAAQTAQLSTVQQQLGAERSRVGDLQRQLAQVHSVHGQQWDGERGRLQATIESVTAARDAAQAARATAEAGRTTAEQQLVALRAEIEHLNSRLLQVQQEQHRRAEEEERTRRRVSDVHIAEQRDYQQAIINEAAAASPPAAAAHPAPSPQPPTPRPPTDPSKMTINAIKTWMTENGYEAKVWEMSQAKAKKADFVEFMTSL